MALEIGSSGTKIMIKTTSKLLLSYFALVMLVFASPSRADTEKRIAFVVGNSAYQAGPLATPANDAGLIAQTLQAAGFDVTGARDLDGESLRAAFRDFLDKAQASGPDTVAFVYLAGYGLQLDGENYFAPVDAKIASAQDVAVEALRVSDYTKRLAGLPLKASLIVLDAARGSPFAKSGPPLAGGLALADAEPNMLVAFNASPGTVSPAENGPYGAYARALTEMIREGGLPAPDVFDGVRLRVNEETKGAFVPWDASRIAAPFVFFERAADAPPPALAADRVGAMRSQPLHGLGAQDAYAAAIERDTLQGYEEFLAAYPSDPLTNRVRALLAARREAITWRRTCRVDTPAAYWSYLNRYQRGPHVFDARRRLATLAAAEEPPPSFSPIVYDVPPPPPAEIVYVDRPVLVFSDPVFGFVQPPPIVFLAPVPAYLVFPPPPPPIGLFVLPVPVFVPVPLWINPPAYVAAPPGNVIFNNIHNTTIIDNSTNVINPGEPRAVGVGGAGVAAGVAAGAAAGAIAAKVALPPSLAHKAAISGGPGVPGARAGSPGAVPATRLPASHELPGANGVPLQGPGAKPGTPPSGQPGAMPSTRLPAAQALPGANGKPLPGPPQNPPGAPPRNNQPAAQASPSGQGVPTGAGGNGVPKSAKPPPVTPPGVSQPAGQKPPNAQPTGQNPPQNRLAPSVANGKPAVTGPKPQQAQQNAPRQVQQRPPQQIQHGNGVPRSAKPLPVTAPGVSQPAGQKPPNAQPTGQNPPQNRLAPSVANGKPAVTGPAPATTPKPQQAQQNAPRQVQQRPPQQAQKPSQPPSKQKPACGKPGLPPCR
jgi:uncharacterized caspase-like protein